MPKMSKMSGQAPTLEEAQGLVGGDVQQIVLSDGSQMLFDVDGKHKGLTPNLAATTMAIDVLRRGDFIVGDVLILEGTARW